MSRSQLPRLILVLRPLFSSFDVAWGDLTIQLFLGSDHLVDNPNLFLL